MNNYNLGFISGQDIYNHVRETVIRYASHMDLKKFNKNIVDPIKLTFDQKVSGTSIDDVIRFECLRQEDKANNNHIGYFHQNIFRYAGNGWKVPSTGFDVINDNLHYYVEMKNKHNTMNSASAQRTYIKMQNKILEDDQATCILVEVIAKHSQNIKWKASIDNRPMSHNKIRRMSMDKFYELVFGDSRAFFKLCKALPMILDDVVTDISRENATNTVLEELQQISPDITKSLYLLAFSEYEGFNDF